MEKHKAKIMGSKNVIRYNFERFFHAGNVYSYSKPVEWEIVYEGELENPPLKENDYIFVEDIKREVKINRIVRSTNGGYIYYSNYIIEKFEDVETERTKKLAEEMLEKYESNSKQTNSSNKKWYQFWK